MMNFFRRKKAAPKETVSKEADREKLREEIRSEIQAEILSKERLKQKEEVRWLKSMLSHSVRMPLSIIMGYGELLQNHMIDDPEKQRECLEKICGNVRYLAHIVALVIDGNEDESRAYSYEEMNLTECIREVAGYVERTANKRKIGIRVISEPEKIMIQGDYNQIMRVFFNLLENSMKYMGKPGNITIRMKEEETGELHIIYEDNGKGMPAEEASHIFEKGMRGSNSRYGDGIGLYLVKKVIDAHGGEVYAKSDSEKGFKVFMFLKNNLKDGNL